VSAAIVIMAGGTGGHVFPALAIAERLRARGIDVSWLGTRRGLEADLVPRAGFEIDWVSVSGLRGNGVIGWLLAPARLLLALVQALAALRRRRPVAVLGMGGFASGPGGVAAWLLAIPMLVHEQNAVAGLTNRLLVRIASRVMEAFAGTFPAARGALTTGNPVRPEIAALPPQASSRVSSTSCTRPGEPSSKRRVRPTPTPASRHVWSPLSTTWPPPTAGPTLCCAGPGP
jgi:UDP-N-acetylglucosamine--N-acetylmuramyl-(pentapeptide) pyrophosphoryl-undecaprenol N-acetylglucosamine transferase